MVKVYNIFSYIITFFMLLSLYIFLSINFLKIFLSHFYSKFTNYINMFVLVSAILFSLYITIKYYTPSTHHFFHDGTY